MAGLPGKCERCGHVFESTKWGATGLTLGMKGFVDKCPKCGGRAPLIEGTFTFPQSGGVVSAVDAPAISHEIIEKLRQLTERVKGSTPSEEELLESVEAISPALAKQIAPLLKRRGVLFALLVIAYLVTHLNLEMKATIDLNQIFATAVQAVEGTQNVPHRPLQRLLSSMLSKKCYNTPEQKSRRSANCAAYEAEPKNSSASLSCTFASYGL
jgi:hypothetical protein